MDLNALTDRCLGAFVAAGTLDLSLDRLADAVGTSKRMLVHYFGGREELEMRVIGRLEDRLRARFSPEQYPAGTTLAQVLGVLWETSTAPESRGVLQVAMEVSRRGWSGSERAKAFYMEQQRLWVELLRRFGAEAETVEELLQVFQGAVLIYLVTGDRDQGRRGLARVLGRRVG